MAIDDYSTLPPTRAEALRLAARKYFDGEECRYGHTAPRFASNSRCVVCAQESKIKFRLAHRHEVEAAMDARRQALASRARPVCSVAGCESPAKVRGWCRTHYARVLRHGDPLHERPSAKLRCERAGAGPIHVKAGNGELIGCPRKGDFSGIYKIVNKVTGRCYVGQSERVRRRITEHFRLLRIGKHPNPRLQNSYRKHGEAAFYAEVVAVCDSVADLDVIENAFLTGEARFDEPVSYNVAQFAKAPMRGKQHSEQSKAKIRAAVRASIQRGRDFSDPELRAKLRSAHARRQLADPEFMERGRKAAEASAQGVSYAEIGRMLGMDTSSARKAVLRYLLLKEHSNG